VIFHSDHGCQYTADAYRDACTQLGVTQSMGTVGDSYDNAMAESFFASLKRELVDDEHFATRADARAAVFEWLNWYNTDRLHSALHYRPPVEYEQHLTNHQQQQHECPLRRGKFTNGSVLEARHPTSRQLLTGRRGTF
jgi:transposase InsO family protein